MDFVGHIWNGSMESKMWSEPNTKKIMFVNEDEDRNEQKQICL